MSDSSPVEPYDEGPETEGLDDRPRYSEVVRRFRLELLAGNEPVRTWESRSDRCGIGSHPSNEVVLDDSTASRFHCEILLDERGARIRDLDSRNGILLDGVTVFDAALRSGCRIQLGRSVLRFRFDTETNRLLLSGKNHFGSLIGSSPIMRHTFALLESVAVTSTTVLLEGETGTGKEVAAAAIHHASPRAAKPLVVVDCGSIPRELIESELFGYERGAFTGADRARAGAFEEADGGTLFLDEVGELAFELQPKLLRALEQRTVKRLGAAKPLPVNLRVIAATNRDLRKEVNAGRFRADLFYRLAVVRIPMPPLRDRLEDLDELVAAVLAERGAVSPLGDTLRTSEFLAGLRRSSWPGNVRELRNHLERCLMMSEPLPVGDGVAPSSFVPAGGERFDEARKRALDDFERHYLVALLKRHNHNVSRAAQAAGIAREYLHRLARRHGIRR